MECVKMHGSTNPTFLQDYKTSHAIRQQLTRNRIYLQQTDVWRFDLTPRHEFHIVWVTGTKC